MQHRAAPVARDAWTAVHVQALREHRLLLQHCGRCGHPRWPMGPICPDCWDLDCTWRAHAGGATVVSFVWYVQSLHPRFPDVPYNVAMVRLDDGPVLAASVVDVEMGALRVGDRVHARYSDEAEGFTVLLFAPGAGPAPP